MTKREERETNRRARALLAAMPEQGPLARIDALDRMRQDAVVAKARDILRNSR